MIKINLLPHREEKRKQKRNAFYAMLGMSLLVGTMAVILVGAVIDHRISNQQERNAFISAENAKLDQQIREVASLKKDIQALKARQKAVEDLQGDRNQPVHLMDELAKHVPEGVYIKTVKQRGQNVSLSGVAQSNERVSELLRNLGNNSVWIHKPDLVEIRVSQSKGNVVRRVYDFTINVGIKRPSEQTEPATKLSSSDWSLYAVADVDNSHALTLRAE